jgi:hypothetical protein
VGTLPPVLAVREPLPLSAERPFMKRGISLLSAAALAAFAAGCAGPGAGGARALPVAPAAVADASRAPDAASPLAGAIVATDYSLATVSYLAPKTGKLLYQLAGKSTKLSNPSAVAVDRHRNTYVLAHYSNAANQDVYEILEFDAKAPLQAHPKPVRVISGPNARLSSGALAVDSAGRIYATEQSPSNAVLVFGPKASGNAAPKRVITGADTQLAQTYGIAVAHDGTIHVATLGAVLTFAATANGDAAPVSTLSIGGGTGQATGVFFDTHGHMIVSEYAGAVDEYAATAAGSDAPLWTLAGNRTQLASTYTAVTDRNGFVFASYINGSAAGVGIFKPGGGNAAASKHLPFSFPGFQMAVMP